MLFFSVKLPGPAKSSSIRLSHGATGYTFADCDGRPRRGVPSGGGQRALQWCVADPFEVEYPCIVTVEAFDERLGRECPAAGCAGFDSGSFVDLVAECGHLGASDR